MKLRSLLDPNNWHYSVWILLAGYSVGLFCWQVTHWALMPAYLFENQLTVAQRLNLVSWLGAGVIFVMLGSLVTGTLLARIKPQLVIALEGKTKTTWLKITAYLSVWLLILPLLPPLALPRIETEHRELMFVIIIVTSVLVAGAMKGTLAVSTQRYNTAVLSTRSHSENDQLSRSSSTFDYRPSIFGLALVLIAAAAYALFMSALTIGRHNAFGTNAFDFGIHIQALYSIIRRGYPIVTLYGPEAVNQFGDHFSPIFYLIIPIMALFGDARALLVLQSIILAAGAIPVYLLACRKLTSQVLALVLALSYLLFPALHGINNFDFHEIALVTTPLLFSLYFLEIDRIRAFSAFLTLSLFTKEEVALTGIAIGLYTLFIRSKVRQGALVTLASTIYFILVIRVIMPALGGGADIGRFNGIKSNGFDNFSGIILTIITNPFYTFSYTLLNHDKLLFLAQLLLPVLGIPLLAGIKPWIVAIPGFATLLLSSYRPQYLLDTHYSAIVVPSIFFLTVLGLARIEKRYPSAALPMATAILTASLLMNWQFGWLGGKLFKGIPRPTERHHLIAMMIDHIPPEASVSTLSKFRC